MAPLLDVKGQRQDPNRGQMVQYRCDLKAMYPYHLQDKDNYNKLQFYF